MPPKGWRKPVQSAAQWLEAPKWNKNYLPFGDRLDFLSPEKQHLATGKLRILAPRGERHRPEE